MKIPQLMIGIGLSLVALSYLFPFLFRPNWTKDDFQRFDKVRAEYKKELDRQVHTDDSDHQHDHSAEKVDFEELKKRYDREHAKMEMSQNSGSWSKSKVPWVIYTSNIFWVLGIVGSVAGLVALKASADNS